jgi:hypothetical protein
MAVKAGANPAATGHAAEGLAKMWKTESPGPVADSSDGEGSSQTTPTNGTGTTAQ